MSIWRRYTRRDGNEKPLVKVMEQLGATWQPLSIRGGPDGMVGINRRMVLVEIKQPKGAFKATQPKWYRWWRGTPVEVLRTPEEAVALVQRLRAEETCAYSGVRLDRMEG